MRVHTRVGDVEGPDPKLVTDRVRFWAEAMSELIKTEELFSVMGAALLESSNWMLEAIRGSLRAYPNGGGDVEVMREVERIREEAYRAGARDTAITFLGLARGEVIDVEAKPVQADSEESVEERSQPAEPADPDQVSGPAEPPFADAELPGSVPEGAGGERGDQAEVAEGPGAVSEGT